MHSNTKQYNENYSELNSYQNTPVGSPQNTPLAQLGQYYFDDDCGFYRRRRRRYTNAQQVERLAIEKYNKNGKGITFNDLLSLGLALHKEQAQTTLKHCLRRKILFTISAQKPQEYFPTRKARLQWISIETFTMKVK
jgi:hypothetical protein